MEKLISFLCILGLSGAAFALPPFQLRDQNGKSWSSTEFSEGDSVLVYYSSRNPTEKSKGHYEYLRSVIPEATALVRIANIRKAPGIFHFLITGSVRNDQPEYPLLFDPTGVSANSFGVEDESCGYFYFRGGKEVFSFRERYTNEEILYRNLSNLAAKALEKR